MKKITSLITCFLIAGFAQNEQQPLQEQYPSQTQGQYQYQPQVQYQYSPQQQVYPSQQATQPQQKDDKERLTSVNGSVGYGKIVLDELKDYPFEGFGFNFGTLGFIPLTDVAKFGSGISINYITASAEDEYDVKLTISEISLNLSPQIRFGQEKNYVDISFGMSIPLSSEVTLKRPGYRTETEKVNDSETFFQLSLAGRYKEIGLAIGKGLTGNDKAIGLSAAAFISITEQVEIVPYISYSRGDVGKELDLAIEFDYWL